MSALNNLKKKETFITLGEDELLAERVESPLYHYDKTFAEHLTFDLIF